MKSRQTIAPQAKSTMARSKERGNWRIVESMRSTCDRAAMIQQSVCKLIDERNSAALLNVYGIDTLSRDGCHAFVNPID